MSSIYRIKKIPDVKREGQPLRFMDLGDDGYRLYGKFPDSDNAKEWTLILEYKHADFPGMANALVEHLMRGAEPYIEEDPNVEK